MGRRNNQTDRPLHLKWSGEPSVKEMGCERSAVGPGGAFPLGDVAAKGPLTLGMRLVCLRVYDMLTPLDFESGLRFLFFASPFFLLFLCAIVATAARPPACLPGRGRIMWLLGVFLATAVR